MLLTSADQVLDSTGRCPKCDANWDGGSIFFVLRDQDWCKNKTDEELRQYIADHYGDAYGHFSRLIGVEIRGRGDRVHHWRCPDCQATWLRKLK